MECNFIVGQKVCAVGVSLSEDGRREYQLAIKYGISFPKDGFVYTIREICVLKDSAGVDRVCIRLVEIANPTNMRFEDGYVGEVGFPAESFRPLIERKTDISIFTSMLTGDKVSA